MKQSWRPVARNSEGYSYNLAKGSETNYIGVILSCEDAMIEDEKDETSHFIRQLLDVTLPPRIAAAKKRTHELVRKFEIDGFGVPPQLYPSLRIYYTEKEGIRAFSIKHPREAVSRIRTRLLSSSYGWPLKHFSTLGELLRVLQGAIQGMLSPCIPKALSNYIAGHKYLYANGVLHRDISPENIIIEWQPGSQITTASSGGYLIDLDRARVGEKIPDTLVPKVDHPGWDMGEVELRCMLDRITCIVIQQLPGVPKFQVQDDVALRAFELLQKSKPYSFLNYSADAIEHAAKFDYLPEDHVFSCKTLNWEQVRPYVICM